MRVQAFALSLVLVLAGVARAVTITSISPTTGPTSGGTLVTIKGTGFMVCPICSPPLPGNVWFGDAMAARVAMVDENTMTAVTGGHMPGTVDVRLVQWDGEAMLPSAFTYVEGEREAILLPVFTQTVFGQNGSEFRTELFAANKGPADLVFVYGLERPGALPTCIPFDPIGIGQGEAPEAFVPNGTPGRILYVPSSDIGSLTMNLRAYDVSRAALNFGTELPIVRQRDFTDGRIVLVGVPTDPRFRSTLRVYSFMPVSVKVTIEGEDPFVLNLTRGDESSYSPAYAQFGNFPASNKGSVTVTVERAIKDGADLPVVIPIWAFISVTNNETQMITTITPQP